MFYRVPQTIYLVGDSLVRGFGLGVLATEIAPSHALYGLSSPARMANLVLSENGIPARCYFSRSLSFGGYDSLLAPVTALMASGEMRRGDWLIFEDAGPHGSDPDAYQEALEDLLEAASASGINRAVMTTFDYAPAPAESQYDTAFGGRTVNEAIVAAADATDTPVLDMNAIMDAFRSDALAADGLPVMQGDGIHANVWGQMKMAGAILDFVGLADAIETVSSLTAIAANHSALGYGAAGWSEAKAVSYCEAIRG